MMTKFKKTNYQFWHSPIVLILFFCLFVYFGYRIIDLRKTEKGTVSKKELVLDEIDNLKKREKILVDNISKLETEGGKEEIIREKYQVAKPDEKMVVIVDKEPQENSVTLDEKVDHGFWSFVKRIFKF